MSLIAQRIADGRVLSLIKAMLKAGSFGKGRLFPSERGTPQGGVASPLLSNILLTPFDREMRRKGYQLTRYADDWVITCSSQAEARAALAAATKILSALGVHLHPQKTRIVHVRFGFEFLGYKIKRGRQLSLPSAKIRSGARSGALYAYPREKSVQRFMDQVRRLTQRCVPLRTRELIGRISLELHPDKTRLLEFGRYAAVNRQNRGLGRPETFTFLGFIFICGRSRRGAYQLQRKTRGDRMRAKLRQIKEALRKRMHEPTPAQGQWLRQVVRGYFAYHAVPTNSRALVAFRHHVTDLWRRTLRRRSQKDAMTWERMRRLANVWLPLPRILHPWPDRRFAVKHPR
ncbi:reverse transcriptase domain-containing protein [Paraburkholderia sp. BR10954]|uniref:reverse transcriptase domain-containing protein n=1 Tax=Paraburkholderia sp. BR10954 TaxID=3236995 RepID=UPI0034D1A82D